VTDPAHAGPLVAELADDRRARGQHISADQVGRAAELLVDLRTAGLDGLGPDYLGSTTHPPCPALDGVSTPPRRPPRDRPRPRGWKYRRQAEC
jgi:hypothetical protein